MNTRIIGVATLFAASSLLSAATANLGATAVESAGGNAEFAMAGCGSGSCGGKDTKADAKASSTKKADQAKGMKKDGSCGKDKKKDGRCGKEAKKDASCGAAKK